MAGILGLRQGINAFLRAVVAAFFTPQAYQYLRMAVSAAQPSNDGLLQWSEVHWFDTNGSRILPVSVARVGGNVPNSAEEVGNLIDGDTATKLASNITSVTAVFTFSSKVRPGSYRWATANDVPSRDPYNWTIDGSNDNATWTTLETVTAQTASMAARQTLQPMRYINFSTAPSTTSPLTLGLAQRFRASSLTGLADGALVPTWAGDFGPLTVAQTTSANRPTYKASGANGKPAVNFNATTNQWLDYASGTLAIPQPVSAVFIINPTTASNRQLLHGGGIEYFLNLSGNPGYGAYAGSVLAVGSTSTGPQVYIASLDSANTSSLYVNGVLQGSGNIGTGGINQGVLTIGNHSSDRSRPYDGDMHEVMLFNRQLTPIDRAQINRYSFEQYGIASRDGITADPASIQNMSFRMRASDSVSLLASGATITNALDLSGKGNHLTTYSNADSGPTWIPNQINGHPVFRFSGANQALQSTAPADRIQTIVLVHKPSAGASTIRGASASGGLQFRMAGTNQYNFVKQNVQDYGVSSRQYPTGIWRSVIASMDPAVAGFYRVDGRRDIGAYSGGALTTGSTTVLGMNGVSKTENYVGDIAEIIVYDRILTSAEEATLNRYITARYGIVTTDAPYVCTERWFYADTSSNLPVKYLLDGNGTWAIQSNSLLLQANASAYASVSLLMDGINPGDGLYWDFTSRLVMSSQNSEMYAAIGITADKVLYYSDNRFFLEVASNNGSPQMNLYSRIAGTTVNVAGGSQSLTSLGITVTTPFNLRLQYDGVWLRARAWADGATEPAGWHLVGQPSAPIIGKPTFSMSSGNDTTTRAARFYSLDATSVRPTNYTTTGTFDTAVGDWYVINGGTFSRDTTRKYEGVASLKVTDGGATAGNADAATQASTIPGRQYTISAWLYVPSGQSQNPQVNISASGIGYGTTVSALDTWTQSTCTFTATNAVTIINVGAPSGVNNATNTYYYVDSVTLTEAGAPALTVVDNGDGTATFSGSAVVDNGNGSFTISGSNVGDNGDGTFTTLY